ncbi:hypothetical protein HPP92_025345 [Vanilla planifolia]|uniref:Uncharacterized protein n=1 Tax=Vanilla planifolia TaxID=51239 RepID=A0A835PHQ4_VANPL|nr:hypothetical protein HPP92_025345 [Vanilla planifolia]
MFCLTSSGATSFNFQHLLSPSLQPRNFYPIPKSLRLPTTPISYSGVSRISAVISANSVQQRQPKAHHVKIIAAGIVILAATTARMFSGRLSWAFAEAPPSSVTLDGSAAEASGDLLVECKADDASLLSEPEQPNSDIVGTLRPLLYQKLEEGDDLEALSILRQLMVVQPIETEWKFLAARLLNEMGKVEESRHLLDELLESNPLSLEALFENAVLMERCGEGSAAVARLNQALELARAENREAVARDIRLIMAQIQYLQRNVKEALTIYDELSMEDPKDYRPFFCLGVIYTLLDQNSKAREKFALCNELSQKKAEVNAYLQTPLSRVKLFGTGDS